MDSNTQSNTDESITILSPPLSPYPKQIPLATSFLNRPLLKPSTSYSADTGVQTPAAEERDDSPAPTAVEFSSINQQFGDYLPTTASLSKVSKPKTTASSTAARVNKVSSTTWSVYKHSPRSYYKKQQTLLAMYPTNGPTWSNYVYIEGTTDTASHMAAVTVAALRPVKSSGSRSGANNSNNESSNHGATRRTRRSAHVANSVASAASSDNESDSSVSSMLTRSAFRGGVRQRFSRDSTPLLATAANAAAASAVASSAKASSRAPSRPSTPRPRQSSGVSKASRSHTASPAPSRVHELSLSQITDYSPSADTLPAGKSLRAEWKGAPMDLSNDPNVGLLHPAEVHLASVLRLPADVYLDSKKRLFAEKVHRLKQGLPFRRTDSQKACRIDVNKASRLFSAFEKVGWLDDKQFTKFL